MAVQPVASGTETPRRIPEIRALTGLRIVAAMWVVLFHWSFTPGDEYREARDALHPILHYGYLGVDVFYVLSGYVITLTYLHKLGPQPRVGLIGHYIWARICRIWPAYILVTVLFGLWLLAERNRVGPEADITFQTRQPDLGVWSWIKQTLMIQQWDDPWSDGVSFVGPTWSVSAEVLAYLLFPVAVLFLYRLRNLPWWVLAAGSILVTAPLAYHALRTGQPYFPYSWAVRLFTGFTAGALACLAVQRLKTTERTDRVAGYVAILGTIEVLLVLVWATGEEGDKSAAATILFPIIVGAIAISTKGISKVLSTRAFVLGGRVSYSLYLIHVPIFEIFWIQQMQRPTLASGGPYAQLLVPNLILASLIGGYMLWKWVEEPARHKMRTLVERRSANPMPVGAATAAMEEEENEEHHPPLPERSQWAAPNPAEGIHGTLKQHRRENR